MNRLTQIKRLLGNYYEYRLRRTVCRNLPTRLFLEPTNICNLKCVMCPTKDVPREKKGLMDFGLLQKIIDEAATFARDVNFFLSGEPFAHPRAFEAISYIKSKGMGVRIHTNGTLLDGEKSDALVREGVDLVSFSLDGYDAATYNSIRKNADFDKTIDNIMGFLMAKKRAGYRKPFTVIQTLVLDEENFDVSEQRKFIRRFDGLPVDRFTRILPHAWAGQMQMPGSAAASGGRKYRPCIDPWFVMNILWNGDIVPCCNDYSGAYVVGNVSETSLKTAWNNDRMQKLRSALAEGPEGASAISLCSNCDRLYEERVMGIPVRNLRYYLMERFRL